MYSALTSILNKGRRLYRTLSLVQTLVKQHIVCCTALWLLATIPAVFAQEQDSVHTSERQSRRIDLDASDTTTPLSTWLPLDPVRLGVPDEAYRIGTAYVSQKKYTLALRIWEAALRRLQERNQPVPPPLADAYIRTALRNGTPETREEATAVYLDLLRQAGQTAVSDTSVLGRYLRQMAVVLPASMQDRTGLSVTPTLEVTVAPTAAAGSLLVAWWRGQDQLPATPQNERLEEHLQRVAYAEHHYQDDGRLDDRGLIYIRLGEPSQITMVDFDHPQFRDRVIRRNPTLTEFDFPENEFWIYEHLDRSAYYLFVENEGNGRMTLSETQDLFPRYMRHGLSTIGRGYRKAYSLVHTMEQVYRELGLYHEDFMERYTEASTAAAQLDMREFAGGPISVDQQSAFDFGQQMLSLTETQDAQHRLRREENVPSSYSTLLEDTTPFPVHVRYARFRDADGTTRTEVYWSVGIQGMVPSDVSVGTATDSYRIVRTGRHLTPTYQTKTSDQSAHVVHPKRHRSNGVLQPQTWAVQGDTGLYHVALQWDQYRMASDSLVKRNIYRLDSLTAFPSNADRLLMSDVKPLTVPKDRSAQTTLRLEDTIPYPFTQLRPETPLALYFEVYGLSKDENGRTRYTVSYEVRRWKKKGLWKRIFGGDDAQVTTTQTTYTGQARETEEYLFLEQSEWKMTEEEVTRLQIMVRVTDEHTGRTVQRAIQFRVPTP